MNTRTPDEAPFIDGLFPFTLTRSIPDIRVGILTLREKQERLAPVPALHHPWEIFQLNDAALRSDFQVITQDRRSQPIPASVQAICPENIFIEPGARIGYSLLNASTGPIYIGANAEVMEGCLIRGPFALCEGAILKMGTKIYGATTIGPYSTAGGEIKNSVIFGYS